MNIPSPSFTLIFLCGMALGAGAYFIGIGLFIAFLAYETYLSQKEKP